MILADLYASNGNAVAVSDETIVDAQHQLGRVEGISAAPEWAATLAALEKLAKDKWVQPDERIVLFDTGSDRKPDQDGLIKGCYKPGCLLGRYAQAKVFGRIHSQTQ